MFWKVVNKIISEAISIFEMNKRRSILIWTIKWCFLFPTANDNLAWFLLYRVKFNIWHRSLSYKPLLIFIAFLHVTFTPVILLKSVLLKYIFKFKLWQIYWQFFSIIVGLQCSVNFYCTEKWPSHIYIYILFQKWTFFPLIFFSFITFSFILLI